jgi:hypothetical protein
LDALPALMLFRFADSGLIMQITFDILSNALLMVGKAGILRRARENGVSSG